MVKIVLDSDVLVAALHGPGGVARQVLRACLTGVYVPLIGAPLFLEYEEVIQRGNLWRGTSVTLEDRLAVLAALAKSSVWTEVYFGWRPNLRDEADNHLIELAVAGNAAAIVTRNIRDLRSGELRFPGILIVTPAQCLKEFPCPP